MITLQDPEKLPPQWKIKLKPQKQSAERPTRYQLIGNNDKNPDDSIKNPKPFHSKKSETEMINQPRIDNLKTDQPQK